MNMTKAILDEAAEAWEPSGTIYAIDRAQTPALVRYLDGANEWVPVHWLDSWARRVEAAA